MANAQNANCSLPSGSPVWLSGCTGAVVPNGQSWNLHSPITQAAWLTIPNCGGAIRRLI